jgi:hypothetical protein
MDLVEPEELENRCVVYNALSISALKRETLGKLVCEISERLNITEVDEIQKTAVML